MGRIKWVPVVNRIYTPDGFRAYAEVTNAHLSAWKPTGVVLHNTATPNLTQWAQASWQRHIEGLVSYYRDTMHWHAGPHLFVAPEGIIVFTPIVTPGVHSPSFNQTHLGVEMVGDYSFEDFNCCAGLRVHNNAVSAVATLCELYHIDSHTMLLHKEDPKTTHDCPGKHVSKQAFIQEVHGELMRRIGDAV